MSISKNFSKICKILFLTFLLLANAKAMLVYGQNAVVDSLKRELGKSNLDINKWEAMKMLSESYQHKNIDTAILYAKLMQNTVQNLSPSKQALSLMNLGVCYGIKKVNLDTAMAYFVEAKKIFEREKDTTHLFAIINNIVNIYILKRHNY